MPENQATSRTRLAHLAQKLFRNARKSSCDLAVARMHPGHVREFIVGGENNLWAVPSSVDEFNKWDKKTHFRIGVSLVLKYNFKTDSMLEVNEEDYKICPFFFISGAKEHRQKGQKLEAMVLSEKDGSGHQFIAQAPSPHHHRHHYHAPTSASTNGGIGLKAMAGFICGTTTVGSSVPAAARMHPELGQHIVPTNSLEMLENRAAS
ncbi:early nodulin-like protein 3 [Olea europaea var. sylvestris]|uniref:early nodulin-like protein 3 n=1 Tax=Olea europaea var. sylvestris TaxID=158386 RepID=UPI000C1D3674|nr:early nodulin-like protein 3 [Olea europaea var. sylvestris]